VGIVARPTRSDRHRETSVEASTERSQAGLRPVVGHGDPAESLS